MMRANVRIQANEQSKLLAKILMSESDDEISRSKINITDNMGEVQISIAAEDVVALRAAMNSYLRWTKLAMDTNDAIGGIQ